MDAEENTGHTLFSLGFLRAPTIASTASRSFLTLDWLALYLSLILHISMTGHWSLNSSSFAHSSLAYAPR